MRRLRFGLWIAALSVFIASPVASQAPSDAARDYFRNALKLIREHHHKSSTVDWDRLIPQAEARLIGATSPGDTYPAIRFVLESMNEPHSFLVEPAGAKSEAKGTAVNGSPPSPLPMPWSHIVERRFGYLALPALNTFGPDGEKLGNAYQEAVRTGVKEMDKAPICGWIIDLRQNGGGNMWPMLRGLDPLLGRAPFGYFVRPDGRRTTWLRSGGNIFPYDTVPDDAAPAYSIRHTDAPIAVLIGPHTASSGEMTAIALIGRARVRLFGAPSAGFTTGNKTYPLSDGAVLALTEVTVQDRTGKGYAGPIQPDEEVPMDRIEASVGRWLDDSCRLSAGSAP